MPAPARRLAAFRGRVGAAASAPAAIDEPGRGECRCNKCKKGILIAEIAPNDAIEWFCDSCGHDGRISHRRRSFWDLSALQTDR